jgi:hypothetical protein
MHRLVALVLLVAANWLAWSPPFVPVHFAIADLERRLASELGLAPSRFADTSLLPPDHVLLLAPEEQSLLSVYVGCYEQQGLAALGPHDPAVCYAAQGWQVGEPRALPIEVDGHAATVQTVGVTGAEGELFVTWWAQPRGQLPGANEGALHELLQRWRTRRSDVVWVRLEWDAAMAQRPDEVARTAAQVAAAVQTAVQPER